MTTINYSIITLLAVIWLSKDLDAQTLDYVIESANQQIGQMSVSKKMENNVIHIDAVSEIKAKVFIPIQLKYSLTSRYRNDSLIFSAVTITVNGKQHSSSKTEKVGDHYSVTKNGHFSTLDYPIPFSGARLYFEEPEHHSRLYSELDNVEKPIKKVSDECYELLELSDGHSSKYCYSNGTLDRASIEHTFMTFTFTRK